MATCVKPLVRAELVPSRLETWWSPQDADGTWYGYYHNEVPATMCRSTTKVLPRIGLVALAADRVAWSARAIALRVAALGHEQRQHTVEGQVVIKAALGEREKIRRGLRSLVLE